MPDYIPGDSDNTILRKLLQNQASGPGGTITASQISDSSAVGRAVLTAPTAAAQKAVLAIASTDITDSTAAGRSLLTAANAAAQKTLLAIASTDITDSTAAGRSILTAATAAAQRTQLELTDLNRSLQVRAAGTAYTLTATPALADFGTTDPSLILDRAGTWAIYPFAAMECVGATFAASQVVTTLVRRVNNTAADLGASTARALCPIMTTANATIPANLPPFIYTTVNNDDQLQLFVSIAVLPSAGSVTCNRATIVAVLLTPAGF